MMKRSIDNWKAGVTAFTPRQRVKSHVPWKCDLSCIILFFCPVYNSGVVFGVKDCFRGRSAPVAKINRTGMVLRDRQQDICFFCFFIGA